MRTDNEFFQYIVRAVPEFDCYDNLYNLSKEEKQKIVNRLEKKNEDSFQAYIQLKEKYMGK